MIDRLMSLLYTQFPLLLYILVRTLREKRMLASYIVTGIIGDSIRRVSAGIVPVNDV